MFQAQLVCSSCILIETSKTQATKICKTILPREREREREREHDTHLNKSWSWEGGSILHVFLNSLTMSSRVCVENNKII